MEPIRDRLQSIVMIVLTLKGRFSAAEGGFYAGRSSDSGCALTSKQRFAPVRALLDRRPGGAQDVFDAGFLLLQLDLSRGTAPDRHHTGTPEPVGYTYLEGATCAWFFLCTDSGITITQAAANKGAG